MAEQNYMNQVRREVLRRVAKAMSSDDFPAAVERIPYDMRPRGISYVRCCIYKERAILRFRCIAALGFRMEDALDDSVPLAWFARKALEREVPASPVMTVCDIACSGCVPSRYYVTNACQGCVAHPCLGVCHFGAMEHVHKQSYIDPKKCKGCGRCHDVCPYKAIVKLIVPCEDVCPVKAIYKSESGLAVIDETKCISCGRCMRGCPFGSILERSQLVDVLHRIQQGKHVTAMVAPAIVGQFAGNLPKLVEAMHELGFSDVLEVATGADVTTAKEADEFVERMAKGERFMTTSCCPGYVEAVRLHLPEIVPFVSSTRTPMHYTAEIARKRNPNTVTVFVGPCVAKRQEGLRDDLVDYVLTFEELGAMLSAADINVEMCEEHSLGLGASGDGRGYALTGGVAGAVMRKVGDRAVVKPVQVNGLSVAGLRQLRNFAKGTCPGNLVEVMACEGGCVGGAGVLGDKVKVSRAVSAFAKESA